MYWTVILKAFPEDEYPRVDKWEEPLPAKLDLPVRNRKPRIGYYKLDDPIPPPTIDFVTYRMIGVNKDYRVAIYVQVE